MNRFKGNIVSKTKYTLTMDGESLPALYTPTPCSIFVVEKGVLLTGKCKTVQRAGDLCLQFTPTDKETAVEPIASITPGLAFLIQHEVDSRITDITDFSGTYACATILETLDSCSGLARYYIERLLSTAKREGEDIYVSVGLYSVEKLTTTDIYKVFANTPGTLWVSLFNDLELCVQIRINPIQDGVFEHRVTIGNYGKLPITPIVKSNTVIHHYRQATSVLIKKDERYDVIDPMNLRLGTVVCFHQLDTDGLLKSVSGKVIAMDASETGNLKVKLLIS